ARRVCAHARSSTPTRPSRSFFFQAEDGIRARNVTGVQTCALPISQTVGVDNVCERAAVLGTEGGALAVRKQAGAGVTLALAAREIGRASCRERVERQVAGGRANREAAEHEGGGRWGGGGERAGVRG